MIGGRYVLDRKIGQGGMGSVWLGRDELLGRAVAIKRVGAFAGGSSPDLLRAEREARIAASLNHPHVVGVFDLVHDEDMQWLVMEYVEGTTLAELIHTEGALPEDQLRPVLAQAARALRAAHTAGIVHRDVKPSNLLVREDGQVKLSDFGIARAQADASLTQTGLVTGSPAYLAPEVASGRPATPASDVWSLGATAYHGVVGRPPYDVGDNVLGALYRIVNEDPPRPDRPGLLGPLIEGTMVVDPDRRWSMDQVVRFLDDPSHLPSAAEVSTPATLAALPAVASVAFAGTTTQAHPTIDPAPLAPPVDRPRRGKVLPGAIAAAVVALLALLVVFLMQDDPQPNLEQGSPTGGASSSSTPSGTPSATKTAPASPRAADMRAFARDYLRTADADPGSAYKELTPAFQAASGGSSGYLGFWRDVTIENVGSISADPGALTVSYDYQFRKPELGIRTEHVVLRLAFDPSNGSYLIAGD